ncbi:WD repeat-containing protein 78 [Chamberlinius hualienensis]
MALTQFLNKEEEIVRSIPEKLSKWIHIEIKETKTLWLYRSNGIIYSQYTEEAENVMLKNQNYIGKCQKMSNDPNFRKEMEMQTCNSTTVNRRIQSEPTIVKEAGFWSNSWDLYDSVKTSNQSKENFKGQTFADISGSDLLNKLKLIENLISLNIYQKELVTFRNAITTMESPLSIELLWCLRSPITGNKAVTSLVLHTTNQDMLSAGYGNFDSNSGDSGIACCWSLKNLLHPKSFMKCPSTILSVDFSQVEPTKLACGLADGTVIVFDVESGKQLWNSRLARLYHLGPIWGIKWKPAIWSTNLLEPNPSREEKFLTLSEDGSICQWAFHKECSTNKNTLLQVKLDNHTTRNDFTESLTQYDSLWDFDFDSTILESYFVCTDGGFIYKCSRNNTEKVEQRYKGHQGPVYKIYISPFISSVFLTCSADWTIKLWDENVTDHPLLSLQTSMNPVYDITWSPHSSTVFASVYPSRLDIWDLNINVLEPVLSEKSGWKESFTSILFSLTTNALYVGTDVGKIYVYAIKGGQSNKKELLKLVVNTLNYNEDNLKLKFQN